MNKKLFSLFVIPTLLTGCSSSVTLEFVPLSTYVEVQDNLLRDEDNDIYYCKKEVTPISTKCGNVSSISDFLSYSKTGNSRENIPSTGERKLLVVPISFSDSDKTNQDKKMIFMQNAFFGETSHTNYDSVAGYYNKSSYGQLILTGEVAPFYNIEMSSSEIMSLSSSYMNISSILVEQAIDYLKENTDIDFSQYDSDSDDNIDGVYAIYDHPFDDKYENNNLFWAYTHYTYKGENDLNNTSPYVNDYSWTSIDTIIQSNNRSYTNYLIHETGHLLGLTDYYNTKYTISNNDYHFQPTGCFDMMDYNIGDHSSFSKYLFNWSSPMVIKDNVSTTLSLKPFIDSGEYLLIPSSDYQDNPFGEYLLIEYFAPTGLNDFSGTYSYTDRYGNEGIYKYPSYYGLKIYHVNATMGYYQKSFNSKLLCTVNDPDADTIIGSKNVGLDYAYSNSITDKQVDEGNTPVLCHLLESSGNNTFKDSIPANNDTLFRLNDDFGINTFTDFTFDNGESPNFTLKAKSLSTQNIVLEITHNID